MRHAVLVWVAAALFACAGHSPTEPAERVVAVPFGHSVTVFATTLTFSDVTDSRCARGVVCVWEGDAGVRLESGGDAVVLHTSGSMGPPTARLRNLTVTLLDVKPAPPPAGAAKSDYRVTLRVTR